MTDRVLVTQPGAARSVPLLAVAELRRLRRAGLDALGRPRLAFALSATTSASDDPSFVLPAWRFCWARLREDGSAVFAEQEKGLRRWVPGAARIEIPAGTFQREHPAAGVYIRCRLTRRRFRPGLFVVFTPSWRPIAPRFKTPAKGGV